MAALLEKILIPPFVVILDSGCQTGCAICQRRLVYICSCFEGDSEMSINTIRLGVMLQPSFGHIVKDVLSSASSLQSFSFSHTYKQDNALILLEIYSENCSN